MNASFVMAPAWFLIAIVGIVVVTGIVFAIRAAASSNGRVVGLLFAGLVVGGVLLAFMGVRTYQIPNPPQVVYEQHGGTSNNHGHAEHSSGIPDVAPPRIAVTPVLDPTAGADHEEPAKVAAKPASKPAWLTQGTQTGNGISQFPISSELFATVAECQRDLDGRMPALITEELRFLNGEEFPIPLLPGEGKRLTAETFTEEVPTTSQGNWYKVHRLIKVDQVAWAGIRERFYLAKVHARLKSLGLSFGGLMLVIGVVYLILRRTPRVVDPTLNTFSTT